MKSRVKSRVRSRRRFAQNFLADEGVALRIADAIRPRARDQLLEIGPGRGALTRHLYGSPGRYVAVEIDRDLIPGLAAAFAGIELHNADILKLDLSTVLASGRWRVVGNLPYNISTPLVVKLLEHSARIEDMHFMLQREVAERLAAGPGSKARGRLSVMAQYHCDVQCLFDVPPTSFRPAPKVWSSVVRLCPRERKLPLRDPGAFNEVLRLAFAGRRKLITNALKSLELPWEGLSVDGSLRADRLSVADFVALANATHEEQCG